MGNPFTSPYAWILDYAWVQDLRLLPTFFSVHEQASVLPVVHEDQSPWKIGWGQQDLVGNASVP